MGNVRDHLTREGRRFRWGFREDIEKIVADQQSALALTLSAVDKLASSPDTSQELLDPVIKGAETVQSLVRDIESLIPGRVHPEDGHVVSTLDAARYAAHAVHSSIQVAIHASRSEFSGAAEAAERVVRSAARAPNSGFGDDDPHTVEVQRQDFSLLRDLASRERWDHSSSVSSQVFSLYAKFFLHDDPGKALVVEVGPAISSGLVEYFRQHPERLYSLESRQFEELIAELVAGFGFDVELTQPTRDSGRDIIALSYRPIEAKYLIECKRYGKERTVGIEPVQRLHGVVQAEGASKGIIVTTAPRFTRPAQLFLQEQRWQLEGRAFDGLLQWLDLYQSIQLAREVTETVGRK